MILKLTAIQRDDWSTFARIEVISGSDVCNCGTFTIRNTDFGILVGLLALGARKTNGFVTFSLEDLTWKKIEST